jgi:hypothetical protein
MLSDDEFLRDVLPLLRAKRAAQGRESDSLHVTSGHPSSPKNDPNVQVRSGLWFPVTVSQRSKFNEWANVQVTGHAEARSEDLSTPVDGWIVLDHSVMNLDAERVTLVSVENKSLTGIKQVHGERVKFVKDVFRLTLKGVDATSDRFYVLDFPARTQDHKTQMLMRAWELRKKAREEHQKTLTLKQEFMKLPRVSSEDLMRLLEES